MRLAPKSNSVRMQGRFENAATRASGSGASSLRHRDSWRAWAGFFLVLAGSLLAGSMEGHHLAWAGESRQSGGASYLGGAPAASAGAEGVHPAASRASTGGIAFDPQNGNVYVSSWPLATTSLVGDVTAIDGATNRVVASVNAGDEPGSVTFDSANGYLYVANQVTVGSNGSITVLAAGTLDTVGTIPVGPTPQGVLFDPLNGDVYVCNLVANGLSGSNTTSIIAGSRGTVVGTIPVGCGENGVGQRLALDPRSGELIISNPPVPQLPELSVINTTSGAVESPIQLSGAPGGVAYDPQNNVFYATEGNNVAVINASSRHVGGLIPVGHAPVALALDPANGQLFVANYNAAESNLTVVDTQSGRTVDSIQVGFGPDGMAYDSHNGCIYVVNLTGSVTVINGSTDSVVAIVSTEGPGGGPLAQPLLSNAEWAIGVGLGVSVTAGAVVWWTRRRRSPPPAHPPSA